ncbi:MAG: class I SAM-dependent methyltransferase [Frankia sp.]
MNQNHLDFLASPQWAQSLRTELLPWLTAVTDLGDDVLEIGPGPGLTTDLLRQLAPSVTVVEIDPGLATALADRLVGTNVEVIQGDATTIALPAERFTAATCFSMLHHMPSAAAQDHLFAALHRALRPGGTLAGVDSVDTEPIRQAHVDDTFTPLEAADLGRRLETAGFTGVSVTRASEFQIRFTGRKPASGLKTQTGPTSTV